MEFHIYPYNRNSNLQTPEKVLESWTRFKKRKNSDGFSDDDIFLFNMHLC